MRKLALIAFGLFLFAAVVPAQESEELNNDITSLARSVAGKNGKTEEKTRRLVIWINTNFKWSYTDYEKRTTEEIIRRRAGNCAELANVLALLLTKNDITFRWIREVNIQPKSERRQGDAVKLISERGNKYSVFGFQHNDHVWLEVYDEKSKSWIPADPAVGVVGIKEWISARMAFTERRQPQVAEVARIVKEMLVPVAVGVYDKRTGKTLESRSEFYIIKGFNKFYGKKLQKLPSWNDWKTIDAELTPIIYAAFAGEVNLHEHKKLIEQIAQTYEKLKIEAAELRLIKKS